MLADLFPGKCEWCELPFDDHVLMTEHGFEVCSPRCGEQIEAHAADRAAERNS